MKTPLIVGVSGGTGSGKTLFIHKLTEALPGQISVLSMDNYYLDIGQQPRDENGIENFDLPESLDKNRLITDLQRLKHGENISIKEYTFNNLEKVPSTINIQATPIIIVEGIFTFYFDEINHLLDLKIFIDAPTYLMLSRRIDRDANERGYDLKDVIYRFENHVMPSMKKYISPLKNNSDLIIPNHTHFEKAIHVITGYLKNTSK